MVFIIINMGIIYGLEKYVRKINEICIHCSYSEWGDAGIIKKWHTTKSKTDSSKPWSDIGYHFVVENGYPKYHNYKETNRINYLDGMAELGRPLRRRGAHCHVINKTSIGNMYDWSLLVYRCAI